MHNKKMQGWATRPSEVGHEGTHVMDNQNPFRQFETPFMHEFRGYQTTGWVAIGLGVTGLHDSHDNPHFIVTGGLLDVGGISNLIQAHYQNHPIIPFCTPY